MILKRSLIPQTALYTVLGAEVQACRVWIAQAVNSGLLTKIKPQTPPVGFTRADSFYERADVLRLLEVRRDFHAENVSRVKDQIRRLKAVKG